MEFLPYVPVSLILDISPFFERSFRFRTSVPRLTARSPSQPSSMLLPWCPHRTRLCLDTLGKQLLPPQIGDGHHDCRGGRRAVDGAKKKKKKKEEEEEKKKKWWRSQLLQAINRIWLRRGDGIEVKQNRLRRGNLKLRGVTVVGSHKVDLLTRWWRIVSIHAAFSCERKRLTRRRERKGGREKAYTAPAINL